MNKKTSLIALTSLTATAVALCAAFFSVTGIAKLFAGASFAALVMAGTLEFGKIVGISFLYQYWKDIPRILKVYLTSASVLLMLITSMGIYGFLTAAFQETYSVFSITQTQKTFLQQKEQFWIEDIERYDREIETLNGRIDQQSQIGVTEIQVSDTASSTGTRNTISTIQFRAAQERIAIDEESRNQLQEKRAVAADSLQSIRLNILELDTNSEVSAELGPLQYLSELLNKPMNQIVNWFVLMIVFVFDPLAIALVISVNFLLKYKENDEEEPDFLVEKKGSSDTTESSIEVPVTPDEENYYSDFSPEEVSSQKPNEEPYKVYVSDESDKKQEEVVESSEESSQDSKTEISEVIEQYKKKKEKEATPPKVDENLILKKYMDLNRNGIPEWMEPDFDWDNNPLWINNPYARLFKKAVVDRRR